MGQNLCGNQPSYSISHFAHSDTYSSRFSGSSIGQRCVPPGPKSRNLIGPNRCLRAAVGRTPSPLPHPFPPSLSIDSVPDSTGDSLVSVGANSALTECTETGCYFEDLPIGTHLETFRRHVPPCPRTGDSLADVRADSALTVCAETGCYFELQNSSCNVI
jgi:hypothetical protein